MSNVTSMPGFAVGRDFIEFDGKRWGLYEFLLDKTRPDHEELLASAEKVVARHLKDAL